MGMPPVLYPPAATMASAARPELCMATDAALRALQLAAGRRTAGANGRASRCAQEQHDRGFSRPLLCGGAATRFSGGARALNDRGCAALRQLRPTWTAACAAAAEESARPAAVEPLCAAQLLTWTRCPRRQRCIRPTSPTLRQRLHGPRAGAVTTRTASARCRLARRCDVVRPRRQYPRRLVSPWQVAAGVAHPRCGPSNCALCRCARRHRQSLPQGQPHPTPSKSVELLLPTPARSMTGSNAVAVPATVAHVQPSGGIGTEIETRVTRQRRYLPLGKTRRTAQSHHAVEQR